MKNLLKISALFALLILGAIDSSAQDSSPDVSSSAPIELSFPVTGVCDMCKTRIENAALIKGVKFANWDKSKQTLTIVYKPNKVEPIQVQQSIAGAGYDTPEFTAEDKVYEKLPKCCQYRSGIEVH